MADKLMLHDDEESYAEFLPLTYKKVNMATKYVLVSYLQVDR